MAGLERERERERESVCVCVCARAYSVRVYACPISLSLGASPAFRLQTAVDLKTSLWLRPTPSASVSALCEPVRPLSVSVGRKAASTSTFTRSCETLSEFAAVADGVDCWICPDRKPATTPMLDVGSFVAAITTPDDENSARVRCAVSEYLTCVCVQDCCPRSHACTYTRFLSRCSSAPLVSSQTRDAPRLLGALFGLPRQLVSENLTV